MMSFDPRSFGVLHLLNKFDHLIAEGFRLIQHYQMAAALD
jgi:hypothetical protein